MKKTPAKSKPELEAVVGYLRMWDPAAKNKYDGYASRIFAVLKTGASAHQVTAVLDAIRGEQTGSKPPQSADNRTAIRLVSWYRRTQ